MDVSSTTPTSVPGTGNSAESYGRVALCVCTYRRPDGLRRLLEGLAELEFQGHLDIVVIDNHAGQEGLALCQAMSDGYRWNLVPIHEPKAGIPYARNAGVRRALQLSPDFIAMLDDDEWPSSRWLVELLRIQRETGADFVGGPVKPVFPNDQVPEWYGATWQYYGAERELDDGASCVLYASGNFLGRATAFTRMLPEPFDTYFSVAGGEDLAFFTALDQRGYRMAWSQHALVYESVPESRMSLAWLKDRVIRQSNLNVLVQRANQPGLVPAAVRMVKTVLLGIGGGLGTVVTAPFGRLRIKSSLLLWKSMGRMMGHVGYHRAYSDHGG